MKIKNEPLETVTADEFNKYCKIVVTKDHDGFKAGQELCLQGSAIIVKIRKLPGVLSEEQIQQAKLWRAEIPPVPFRKIADRFHVCHTTIERAVKK